MSSPTLMSLMLSSTDPERLHRWYTQAFPPRSDDRQGPYRILGYGDFYLFLDSRDDIGPKTAEPGRVLLNFDVDDARAVAARIDELGGEWLAPLEDRDSSLFATAIDPDGNYVQVVQLSDEAKREMARQARAQDGAVLRGSRAFSGFSVNDVRAARAFYGETLGLDVTVLDEENGLLELNLSGTERVLVYDKGPAHRPATFTVLNFPVADVEATVRDLTAGGVTFERYDSFPQDDLGIARGPGPRIAWFKDPAGNILSVLEQ